MSADTLSRALRYALSPATEPPPPDRESPSGHWHGSAAGRVRELEAEVDRLRARVAELETQLAAKEDRHV